MAFERTLASVADNDVAEEETLIEEEETSTSGGSEEEENETESEEDTSINESDDEESEDEESVEELKARLEKAESDRDNYKRGMLSVKGKKRAEEGLGDKAEVGDVNEQAVLSVLGKRTEKQALSNTILPKHDDYIPELVDDNQYQEIIGYLPRNIDKTSYESIVRGLKLATKMWKEDRGIKDKPAKKSTILNTTKSGTASGKTGSVKKEGVRKIIRKQDNASSWYN